MSKTVVSGKGQVVIPKDAREKLNLTPGTILRVQVEDKRVILEPLREPPREVFVQAGPRITEPILREAKNTSDKTQRLLRDLGVSVD
jgi:AbrB family looped-hinge helix DNA binding protein